MYLSEHESDVARQDEHEAILKLLAEDVVARMRRRHVVACLRHALSSVALFPTPEKGSVRDIESVASIIITPHYSDRLTDSSLTLYSEEY